MSNRTSIDTSNGSKQTQAMLDEWRDSGADRRHSVRFEVIEAMNRRAALQTGEARRILDERLSKLTDEYARFIASVAENTTKPLPEKTDGALAQLEIPESPAYPKLEVLDYFKDLWTRLGTEKQLRQSLQQVPGNAGPLNSSSLVHRSLSLMHELSPGYLQYFLSYAEALARIEQVKGLSVTERDTSRSASTGKKPRVQLRTPPKIKPR